MKSAIVQGTYATIRTVAAYLPGNYSVVEAESKDGAVIIEGNDSAGWTLDGYVIPRLASGQLYAHEYDL